MELMNESGWERDDARSRILKDETVLLFLLGFVLSTLRVPYARNRGGLPTLLGATGWSDKEVV